MMPMFRGGEDAFNKFIAKHLKYPKYAKENKITGKVIVGFTVGKDGKITDLHVVSSPDDSLSAEAMRLMSSSPQWIPGIQNRHLVEVKTSIAVTFKL